MHVCISRPFLIAIKCSICIGEKDQWLGGRAPNPNRPRKLPIGKLTRLLSFIGFPKWIIIQLSSLTFLIPAFPKNLFPWYHSNKKKIRKKLDTFVLVFPYESVRSI